MLILFLIIILLSVVYSKIIRKDDIVKVFGKSMFIVVTGSMEPAIKAGELIITSDKNNYEKGDIVTFKDSEGYIITHRIVNINRDRFVTKGDNNNIQDEENSVTNIKGKVIFHSIILGIFIRYFLKPLIIIYVLVVITVTIYNFNKHLKKTNVEKQEGEKNETIKI